MKKVIVIIGASRGIGKGISEYFLEKGHIVIGTFNKSLNEANEIKEKYPLFDPIKTDVTNEEEIKKTVSEIIKKYGHIDCLINNAGISKTGLLQDMGLEDYNEIFDVNVKGLFLFTKEVLPYMINKKSGKIINISSMWGITGGACEVLYSASKSAVIGLTKALAKEVGPSNINVNCIAPGVIKTDMLNNLKEDDLEVLREETPLLKIGTPFDIAKVCYFLFSENSDFITGQVLSVDGGIVI
ncbi:MAG: SDR family oxidoreductase [Ruminococcaceae bacterium]|nr:SDR family oxidoreductase [Oscillospiraceae bacterium]